MPIAVEMDLKEDELSSPEGIHRLHVNLLESIPCSELRKG